MKKILFLFISVQIFAQSGNQFTKIYDIETSSVKNQAQSGTCWSFSTSSYLESEIYRINKVWVDISEMYSVRKTYEDKAFNYVYRQGNTQFSEGGLAHDVINVAQNYGIIPEQNYTGNSSDGNYNHTKIFSQLDSIVKSIVKNPKQNLTLHWQSTYNGFLDNYFGRIPEQFIYQNKTFTPKSFSSSLKLHFDDYITLTSFLHKPQYSQFCLSVPDNFSNGNFYNLPLDEYMKAIDEALQKGFTLALDCDVSEDNFSAKYGIAIFPENQNKNFDFSAVIPEKWVTAQEREDAFLLYQTQDDHLMHIVGLYKDQKGNNYYKVKNSWGNKFIGNDGFVMMSAAFLRSKSISVMVHKDALSKIVKNKLAIK